MTEDQEKVWSILQQPMQPRLTLGKQLQELMSQVVKRDIDEALRNHTSTVSAISNKNEHRPTRTNTLI